MTARRPRTLFAWELGGNMGHITVMSRIAAALPDYDMTFAVSSPALALGSGLAQGKVHQAPLWPGQRGWQYKATKPARSLGEALARSVLINSHEIRQQISGWLDLFDELRPELILADYAPGSVLAARASGIPIICYGVGYYTLHEGATEFPVIWNQPNLVPERSEAEALDDVNSALEELGHQPIENLTKTVLGSRQIAMTIPLLDPSLGIRKEPLCSPMMSHTVEPAERQSQKLFIHFQSVPNPNLLEAIMAAGPPATVYIRELPQSHRNALRLAGFEVLDRPADLSKLLPECGGVVSYGGHGLACLALSAGLPQLMVSTDLEKYNISTRIEAEGLGCHIGLRNLDPARLVHAIKYIRFHAPTRKRCHDWAMENRSWFRPSGPEKFADMLNTIVPDLL